MTTSTNAERPDTSARSPAGAGHADADRRSAEPSTPKGLEDLGDEVLIAIYDQLAVRDRAHLACVGSRRVTALLACPGEPYQSTWLRRGLETVRNRPTKLAQIASGEANRETLRSWPFKGRIIDNWGASTNIQQLNRLILGGIRQYPIFFHRALRDVELQARAVVKLSRLGFGRKGDLFCSLWRNVIAFSLYAEYQGLKSGAIDSEQVSGAYAATWAAARECLRDIEAIDLNVTLEQATGFGCVTDASIGVPESVLMSEEEQGDRPPGRLARRGWVECMMSNELVDEDAASEQRRFDRGRRFAEAVCDFGLNAFADLNGWRRLQPLLAAARHSLRTLRLNWADLYMSNADLAEGLGTWVHQFPALEELDLTGGQQECRCSTLRVLLAGWLCDAPALSNLRHLRLTLHDESAEEARQLRALAASVPTNLPALSFLDFFVRSELQEGEVATLEAAVASLRGVQTSLTKQGALSFVAPDARIEAYLSAFSRDGAPATSPLAILRNGIAPQGRPRSPVEDSIPWRQLHAVLSL